MSFEKSVVFRCKNEEYALPVERVVSIEKIEQITPIPHLPNYLIGFTRNRGQLIPVLDFSIILYNQPSQLKSSQMIVLNSNVVNYGLFVNEAKEILDIQESELIQTGLVNYSKTRYFTAIANLQERMITCVDPDVLVNSLEGIREIIEYLHQILENEKE